MENLALDFEPTPTGQSVNALELTSPVQSLAAHFEQTMQQDGSPVRAVRHQPLKPPRFADFPPALNPVLRSGLAARDIESLYTHQAEAVAHCTRGPKCCGGHAHCQRQNPLL